VTGEFPNRSIPSGNTVGTHPRAFLGVAPRYSSRYSATSSPLLPFPFSHLVHFRSRDVKASRSRLASRPECWHRPRNHWPRPLSRDLVSSTSKLWHRSQIQCPFTTELGDNSYEKYSAVSQQVFVYCVLANKPASRRLLHSRRPSEGTRHCLVTTR